MSELVGVDFNHPAAAHPKILDAEQGLIEILPRRKKYAVVGFATSSRDLAPFDDPEWVIAGLNQLYRHIPRADIWYDIHVNWNEHVVEGTDHEAWIKASPIPVFMAQRVPELGPASVRYPIERMIAKFSDYFTSTVAFALAWSIDMIDQSVAADLALESVASPEAFLARQRELYAQHTIGIFGIDLIVGGEYFYQKACAEYFIGQACGRGITVFIPPQSALCKQSHRYGYHVEPDYPLSMSFLEKRRAEFAVKRDTLLKELYTFDGASQENALMIQMTELRLRGGNPV